MRPIKRLQLGKNGLTDAFIKQVQSLFEHERMIKITILKSACRDKQEAKTIAEKLITTLGNKFDYKLVGYVLTITHYRKNQR